MTLSIDDTTKAALAPYGLDEALLASFVSRLSANPSNAVTGALSPPAPGDVTPLPAPGSSERQRLTEAGLEALRAGHVGAVVLAGGMATRFGGVVKAVVPVLGARTFLELKHDDVANVSRRAGGAVPTFVMSSFATHEPIVAHVAERRLTAGGRPPIDVFPQDVSLRLTPSGELFRDADGRPSAYAPGHGDLTFALRRSGLLSRFLEGGGRLLVMSNVDNLGASLDPALVGLHLALGGAVTAEVVRKEKGDKGGAPARVDGVPQIVEGFRFPKAFDQDTIAVFNTNTFVLDARAIDRDFALPFYKVEKQVDGRTAVQFERLVGELTAFVPTRFVEVDREGPDGRFLPAKDPEELARRLPTIEALVSARR
ncbi:MAG: UTP--glucose-1-phosphate uridylyltransferase [Myxococcaceae bacterium]|jgi:UTP--glucose-1-phosphate uridylyltransferase|nr:UTP--glucose-1-phosphate uridylyltransferase [Myxococcaceae bacterium]MCA3012129.1 UTP--glucose-1-phosphate uridylyltransferase [Myxococcaceae bacterium]